MPKRVYQVAYAMLSFHGAEKRVYQVAYATISFHGAELEPLAVTEMLQPPPDTTYRAGEPRLSRSRNGQIEVYSPYRAGHWGMSSKDWVDSPRVARHIEWILNEIEPIANVVVQLVGDFDEACISCYASGPSAEPPSYPDELDNRASALGLHIEIDYYHVS